MLETGQNAVLIIDDDPNNVEIITLDLEDHGYDILTAGDGAEGWEVLQQHKESVKAVLVDRMMPVMNGIEFVTKLKSNTATSRLPVIMQTAAAEKSQVVEGIEAGVYYYLTKPYEADLMRSLVRAAIEEYERDEDLQRDVRNFQDATDLLKECSFRFRTLEEARRLAPLIANLYPDRDRVVVGILELLVNAVEHGNLGVSYVDKGKMLAQGTWEEEVMRLQGLPENLPKTVNVQFRRRDAAIDLRIRDQGDGFDWTKYLEFSPERATHVHGRGIAMSRMMSFDSLDYLGKGNEVLCAVKV